MTPAVERGMIEVLEPIATPKIATLKLAARPESLKGKTVALLNNGKPNCQALLQDIGAVLRKDYGVASTPMVAKIAVCLSGYPAPPALIESLVSKYSLLVYAIGD